MLVFTEIESVDLLQYYMYVLKYCALEYNLDLELDNIVDSLDNAVGRDTEHLQQFHRRT